MGRFPQLRFFDACVVSFEMGSMKPDPEIYREALRRVDSRPESAVFIDDIGENVAGAEQIGIRGILFTPQTDLETELRKAGIRV
jgi:putative hydrolase of the HAD superfamily